MTLLSPTAGLAEAEAGAAVGEAVGEGGAVAAIGDGGLT
jgi:hypothetical protein